MRHEFLLRPEGPEESPFVRERVFRLIFQFQKAGRAARGKNRPQR